MGLRLLLPSACLCTPPSPVVDVPRARAERVLLPALHEGPNWRIIRAWKSDDGERLLLQVEYTEAKNMEGTKLLLLEAFSIEQAIKRDPTLDPHFCEHNQVLARFRPSIQGFILAHKALNPSEIA
jgi:hypothetical protein